MPIVEIKQQNNLLMDKNQDGGELVY